MPHIKLLKPLIIYLIVIVILSGLLNIFIRGYSKAYFSDEKKEYLITTPSQFRTLSEDPCANSIYGDPGSVGKEYVKINIHCGKDNISTNTLELRTISPDNYLGAIQLIGSINSFDTGIIKQRVDKLGKLVSEGNDWRCFIGQDNEVLDYEQKIKSEISLNCFYKFSDAEIKEYYEKH